MKIKNANINCKIKNKCKIFKLSLKIALIFILLIINLRFILPNNFVFAENNNEKELEAELNNQVNSLMSQIDFTELDTMFLEVQNGDYVLSGQDSFYGLIINIINGDYIADFGSILNGVWQGVKSGIKNIIKPLLIVLIIALLEGLYLSLLSKNQNGTSEIIRLVCASVAITIVLLQATQIISNCMSSVNKMASQLNIILPILLTLISGAGGTASAVAFSPVILFLTSIVANVFIGVLFPVFISCLVLSIVGNFSKQNITIKLQGFLKALFKWTISIVCGLFVTILGFQSITAGTADGITLKATKYALKNYIPYLGGYLTDGFEVVKVGGILLKNSIGFASLLLLVATIISPIISLALFSLVLKLFAGLTEFSSSSVSSMLESFANTLKMLVAIIVGVAVMYLFTLVIFISTMNII